jgi:peptidoglycan/LPS O-acetylase OafA/YrhL
MLIEICQPGPELGCRFHGVPGLHRSPLLALTVSALILAVACAAVSYYVLERPILRFKR